MSGKAGGKIRLTAFSFLMLGGGLTLLADAPLLPPMNGQAADFAVRRAGREAGAFVRFSVTNDGLYQVSQPDLVAAGVDPASLTGSALRLFCTTQEVALSVSRDGLWSGEDRLVFFGAGRRGTYSDANVYWLGLEGGGGLRMASREAAPLADTADVTDALEQVRYETKTFLQDKYRPLDAAHDHWYCATITETGAVACAIRTPQVITSETATLSVTLYGHSSAARINPDHLSRVFVNGTRVMSVLFDGLGAATGTCTVSGSLLKNLNSVSFRQYPRKGVPVDRVFLDSFQIQYARRLVLAGRELIFAGKADARNYRVAGLAESDPVLLADVTDPAAAVWLMNPEIGMREGVRVIRFGDDAGPAPRRYACIPESRLMKPAALEKVEWADWGNSLRQADYVIIAPSAFLPAVDRLAARRAGEGLRTAVVSLKDLYNEFSYGIADAAAIKQFIGYMVHHWQAPAPRYVLLAGNGAYDPKGYLLAQRGLKDYQWRERIPVVMGPSDHGWASLDGWYATVAGTDRMPDVALGRLPAQSPGMLSNMISKIIVHEQIPKYNWRRKQALLVADRTDRSLNGKAVCEWLRVVDLSPGGYWCTTAYNDDLSDLLCRQTVLNSFKSGASLVYYFGHGAADRWGVNLLSAKDVPSFRNTTPPVVLMMACRNGAFQNPVDGPSMMEALLQDKENGASACIGTTAISYGASCVSFSDGFSQSLIREKSKRLGDAFLAGLVTLAAYDPYTQELLYLNLFADPAMVFNP